MCSGPSTPTFCPSPLCSLLVGDWPSTVGHRKMVTVGVIVFAAASAMCGLTPKGGSAEAWIVAFRVIQGVGGAIMFPAALAIVVQTFALRERGKALALFFGIAGGLTAVGPVLGGFLPSGPGAPFSGSTYPWPSSPWC